MNLSISRYERLIKEVSDTLDTGDEVNSKINTILQNYSKFNGGLPFVIKTRKLDISKYNETLHKNYPPESFVDHVGIFFNTTNTIYHYTPDGVKSGASECDKEESSYDWTIHELTRNGALFTLITHDEIKLFVDKWARYFGYNYELRASEQFGYTLAHWLAM